MSNLQYSPLLVVTMSFSIPDTWMFLKNILEHTTYDAFAKHVSYSTEMQYHFNFNSILVAP